MWGSENVGTPLYSGHTPKSSEGSVPQFSAVTRGFSARGGHRPGGDDSPSVRRTLGIATHGSGALRGRESGHHCCEAERRAGAVRREQDQPGDRARSRGSRREHHLGHPDRQRARADPVRRHHDAAARRGRRSRWPCRTSKTTPPSTPSPPASSSRPSTSACSATTAPPTSSSRCTRSHFRAYIERGVAETLLDSRFTQLFDLDRLAGHLDPSRDELLKYIGVVTLNNRYGIKARNGETLEVPQYFWMRIAMGLSLNEADPTSHALEFYEKMSNLEYLAAGSTLVNAGTAYPQLSNCFVMEMQDDIEHIAKSVRDVMWLTKGTGGIGLAVTKLRAAGLAHPLQQHHLDGPDPVHAHHRLRSARGQPRRQEVRRPLLLHGELAPGLPGVPRPAPELRRPVPPHPHREHRRVDQRRVHEARAERPGLVPVRPAGGRRPQRALRQGVLGALRVLRGRGRGRRASRCSRRSAPVRSSRTS